MIYWIHHHLFVTRIMNLIKFNNFFYKLFLFNYIIKIYAHKIKHQPKNKHLI
jgi:hypothetical protein